MKKDKRKPPSMANGLAVRFLPQECQEGFLGDLQEVYEGRLAKGNPLYARFMYWFDTFHLLIGFSLLRRKNFKKCNTVMFTAMFKVAWRNALRQKQFTFLNILGLSVGIATCTVIGLYVYTEMTYDTFHKKGERIYRINQPMIWGSWDEQFASTGPNVAIALKEDAPGFEALTRLLSLGEQVVKADGDPKEFSVRTEDRCYAADPNFFYIFSFNFIEGNPATALQAPNTMVVTKATAQRYFGGLDPIGKTLDVKQSDNTWKAYSITGVTENVPTKSHIQYDMLVSMSSFDKELDEGGWKWIWTAFSTYGLVKEGVDINALLAQVQTIPPKWAAATTERIFHQSFAEYTRGKPWTLYLQPLRSIYLSGSPGHHRFGPTGNPQVVTVFASIGILVLALCCINFMNLSTACSSRRAKEVGIRKVMGSQRGTLMWQFVFESILFVLVSTAIGLLMAQLLLPYFNIIAMKQLSLAPHLANPAFILCLVLFVLVLGTLAGSYPAWYLSAFQPIEVLKGKMRAGMKGKKFRNGLIVFQFTISIALIICSFFVQKQLSYTSSLDLGFDKDNILQVHYIEQFDLDPEILKEKLSAIPAVAAVGISYGLPPNFWDGDRYRPDNRANPPVYISNIRADEDYIDLLELKFVSGHNFEKASTVDRNGVILNESAVKALGWSDAFAHDPNSILGKTTVQAFSPEASLEVIGVVKDFNFHSTKLNIEPLMIIHPDNDLFWYHGSGASYLSLRLNGAAMGNGEGLAKVIDKVKTALASLDESVPFKFSFMDEEFENTFLTESRMGIILNIFTGMALGIACLGLFGLAAFSAEQRTKEMGIRKVLGAKVAQLVLLFSSEFTKLVVVAVLVGSPVAFFLVNSWLNGFAYRTPIDIWVFAIAIATALGIAWATIAYQALTAANKNPAKTLKEE